MNFGLRIFGKEIIGFNAEHREVSSIKNPAEWLKTLMGGTNIAGVNVNTDTALNFSGYFGAVKILMETIGILPGGVYMRENNSNYPKDHPAKNLLFNKPNQYQTPQLWHETMMGYACNRGNAYSFIKRDNMMNPIALEMPERQSDIQPYIFEGNLFYRVLGMMDPLTSYDVFHIRGLGFDGYQGLSLVQVAKSYIAGGLASQQYSNDMFASGGAERTALIIPGTLDDEAENKLRAEWQRKYGRDANTKGEVAILQAGLDVKTIGISPEDAQLIDSKKISIEDFSRYTRIPLHMLNSLDKATFNNIEELGRDFVQYTMRPWITKFEQEADIKLFRENQKKNYFTRYDVSSLIRGDSKAMAELVSKMFPTGALNPDEIRDMVFNKNPREDGKGSKYYTAVNVQTDEHAEAKKDKVLTDIKQLTNEN